MLNRRKQGVWANGAAAARCVMASAQSQRGQPKRSGGAVRLPRKTLAQIGSPIPSETRLGVQVVSFSAGWRIPRGGVVEVVSRYDHHS